MGFSQDTYGSTRNKLYVPVGDMNVSMWDTVEPHLSAPQLSRLLGLSDADLF